MPVTTEPPHRVSARRPVVRRAARGALTGTGAVVLASLAAVLGVIISSVGGGGLGTPFVVLFVAGCLLAAARVRRADLRTTVVMGPLVYLGALVLADLLSPSPGGSSWVTSQASTVATNLVVHAPALYLATGATAITATTRRWVAHR
ncbi:MAG: DUF6542 domain-containing protein [Mycobacteriales bacterium]